MLLWGETEKVTDLDLPTGVWIEAVLSRRVAGPHHWCPVYDIVSPIPLFNKVPSKGVFSWKSVSVPKPSGQP